MTPPNCSVADIANEMRQRVALIGSFDPVAELPAGLAPGAGDDVLALLAPDCREQIVGDRVLWFLKPAARLREMERLRGTGEGKEAVVRAAASAPSGDDFGRSLRSALLGVEVDGTSPAELDLAQKSHGFASIVVPEARLKAQRARTRMNRAEVDDSLTVVVPTRLFGREQHLGALLDFASTGVAPKQFWPLRGRPGLSETKMRRRPARSDRVQIFSVSGVGGSGKSALVGKLVQNVRRDWSGPPVVVLDFDRPRLSQADPIELLFDTTRQLGLARPDLQDGLTAFRRKQRAMLESFAAATAETYDVRARVVSTAFSELGEFLRSHTLSHETILLVLDTFEEVLVRPPYVAQVVFRWLDGLRDEVGLTALRVVVSGRVQPHESVPSLASRLLGEMELDDLEFEAAVDLLQSNKVRGTVAGALAETFGGNPLVLKILSQFCAGRSNDEIKALTDERSGERGKFQGEFAQQFLYARILNRISDPIIAKLAHPGLVLRRVTPDLIRSVLAGPCKLGPIGAPEARALFERLAEQVWLVRREGDGSVWHRRDLRRLMLPQVLQETPPPVLEEIHANAATFYRSAAQDAERGGRWKVEARYHELQLDPDAELTTSEAALLLNALGPDLENLPERARARLKVTAGVQVNVTADEAAFLSLPDQERVSAALVSEGRRHGAAYLQVESRSASRARSRAPEDPREAADPNSLTAEKLCSSFDAGSFSVVAARAPVHLQGLMHFARGESWSRAPADPVSTNWWRSALAGLIVRTPLSHRLAFVQEAFEYLAQRKASSARAEVVWPGSTTLEAFVAATACLVSAGTGDEAITIPSQGARIRVFSTRRRTVETVADLRVVNVLLAAGLFGLEDLRSVRVGAGLLAAFSSELSEGGRIGLHRISPDGGMPDRHSYRDRLSRMSNPGSGGPTLTQVDDIIAALAKDWYRIEEPGDPITRDRLRCALRGLTPEIRGVLREAHARDRIPPSHWSRIVENLGEGGVWPAELSGEAFKRAMARDGSRWFATLLSHVDRFGRLSDLLTDVCRESPAARRLHAATELLKRYDSALRGPLPVPMVQGRYAL